MTTGDHLTVVGVFDDNATAQRAIHDLRDAGFTEDELGYAMRAGDIPEGTHDAGVGTKAGESAMSGMVTGGVVGGVAAAAVSLLIPGVGPIIGGGILASVLGGVAAGAATGGLVGTFVGLGVSEDEARYYDNEFNAGSAIVTVRADQRYKEAADIIERYAAPSQEEQERSRAFAANPLSTAIAETAATTGAAAAGTFDYQPRPLSEMTDVPATTPEVEPPIAQSTDEAQSKDGADHQGKTGPLGQWPVRADDAPAGKFVEHEERVTERAPNRAVTNEAGTARAGDAARGEGPYMQPGEDLERVGATSGMRAHQNPPNDEPLP